VDVAEPDVLDAVAVGLEAGDEDLPMLADGMLAFCCATPSVMSTMWRRATRD